MYAVLLLFPEYLSQITQAHLPLDAHYCKAHLSGYHCRCAAASVSCDGACAKCAGIDEAVVLIMAIRNNNMPKFLLEDAALFTAIVSDLFPAVDMPEQVSIHPCPPTPPHVPTFTPHI